MQKDEPKNVKENDKLYNELTNFLRKRLFFRSSLTKHGEGYIIEKGKKPIGDFVSLDSTSPEIFYTFVNAMENALDKVSNTRSIVLYIRGKKNSIDLKTLVRICEITGYNVGKVELIKRDYGDYKEMIFCDTHGFPREKIEQAPYEMLERYGNLEVKYAILEKRYPTCMEIEGDIMFHPLKFYAFKIFPDISFRFRAGPSREPIEIFEPQKLIDYLYMIKEVVKLI